MLLIHLRRTLFNFSQFKSSNAISFNSNLFKSSLSRFCTSNVYKNASKTARLKNNTLNGILFGVGSVTSGLSLTAILNVNRDKIWIKCDAPATEEIDFSHSRLVASDQKEKELPFDFKQLWGFVKPEKWYILASIISALVVSYLNVKIPITLGDLVNVISKFIDKSVANSDSFLSEIRGPVLKLFQYYLAQSFFTFLYISGLSISGERMSTRLRSALFSSIIKQDIAFFDNHKTGEILSRLTSDVQEFKSAFKMCISQGLRSSTQAVGCVISLYLISSKLTGLMVIILPTLIIAGATLGSFLRVLSKAAQAQTGRASAVADEAIGNIRTVRAFAMESKEIEIYENECLKAETLQTSLGLGIGAFQGAVNLALNGIVLGVLGFGGLLFCSEEMSAGSLMSFLVASQTIQRSLTQLSLLFGLYVRGTAAGSRIFQYIQLKPSVSIESGLIIDKNAVEGNVEFKNVTFSYPTRPEQVVLNDFNLTLPKGKIVALCGLSGGGKSTVAALLERFYDIDKGEISLDGRDIRDLNPTWLRGEVIGFINQEPVLFATSVLENIRYGRPDASDEEVYQAAKLANAFDFVSNFPQGFNTVLGERGVTISGGQKQRIAIARALLKDPTILILDEATSALDTESEAAVQDALSKVVKGRTVLVIAHRLSTIQNSDLIAVIANGKVAELGNHYQLQKLKGLYWQLTQQQIIYDKN